MKISLFIPTYNAMTICSDIFTSTLETIKKIDLHKVLIIDSSSTDDTVEKIHEFGFECKVIDQSEFDHGGTRQLGLELLKDSDIIIYLTQDTLVLNVESINKLISPLIEYPEIAATYGRQIPHDNADIFAKHLRKFNYSRGSYVRSYNDKQSLGMDCIFSSDSFAAYKVDLLLKVGGFPDHVIFGEDVYTFAKLVKAGYKVAYIADAICKHSHNYRIWHDFRRYFDIGVFHRSENWILQEFGTVNKHGVKYAFSEWIEVLKNKPWLLPKSFIKTCAKYIGYKCGYNYEQINKNICRKLSMNEQFWH